MEEGVVAVIGVSLDFIALPTPPTPILFIGEADLTVVFFDSFFRNSDLRATALPFITLLLDLLPRVRLE